MFAEQCDFCSCVCETVVQTIGFQHYCLLHAFYLLGELCLTVRAYHKIKELQRLLEIAYSNYRQLGGITEEERKMKKEERKVEK